MLATSRGTEPTDHHRPRGRLRPAIIALATATVTGLALLAAPPGDATPAAGRGPATPSPSGFQGLRSHETQVSAKVVSGGVVTLVTGDRVMVTTYSDGRTVSSFLPGSPHLGKPASTATTPTGSYVIPKLPTAERTRLDPSLFNVTALLGEAKDRVEVEVTFAPGTEPRDVPGITLETAQAHPGGGGSTVVPGHYSASTSGVGTRTSDWRGVMSVDLPAGRPAAVPGALRTHTLTVKVVDAQGAPVGSELAWVINMDDARLFSSPLEIVDGVGTVSVPAGNYAVTAGTFNLILIQADISVQAATTVRMSLADATVPARETVPEHSPAEGDFTLVVLPAGGGSFTGGSTGPRFSMRVQPVPETLLHGTVWSVVDGTFAPTGEVRGQIYSSLAYVKDYRKGVPSSLTFSHPKTDFAIVPQKYYGNGPAAAPLSFTVLLRAHRGRCFRQWLSGAGARSSHHLAARLTSAQLDPELRRSRFVLPRGRQGGPSREVQRLHPGTRPAGQLRARAGRAGLRGAIRPGQHRAILRPVP